MSDQKVSALTDVSLPTLDDLLYFVDNASPPVSYRISLARLLGNAFPSTCQGRLTLASGFPVYAPQPATPSATDTSGEFCTFASAHGWVTGTVLTISATIGGLTAGTKYFINALSATTCAFYTTLANAIADSSRVNLTANVTNQLIPSGVENTNIYFTPFGGSAVCLYDGTRWKAYTFTEITLALGTLTANKPYDVFLYDNSGTLTLELLVWTSATVRATDVVLQNGIYVKSGATTRRLVGTIYTDTTTSTVDDAGGLFTQVGGKRYVCNAQNQVRTFSFYKDLTSSWTYSTATWRAANGATGGAKIEFVLSLPFHGIRAAYDTDSSKSAAGSEDSLSIGYDSTSLPDLNASISLFTGNVTGALLPINSNLSRMCPAGLHSVSALERGSGTVTSTWYGFDSANNNRLGVMRLETVQ